MKSPEFGPASLAEETAYTYISAGNFLRFGFFNSGLLQDFSSSPYLEDHPFVYVHMPAGPDVLTAVLLRLTGMDYRLTRLVFALIFVLGLYVFARFVELLLREQRLAGGGFALLFISPWVLVQGMDRLIYSPFPILAFGPVLLLSIYQKTTNWIYLVLAAIAALISSIYLEYSLLSGILVCWYLLYALKLLPGGRAFAAFLVVPAVAGILLHLIQNFLFLGSDVFLRELANVISNRITGFPTQDALKSWYQEIGVVHHGSRPVSIRAILSQLIQNFHLVGSGFLLLLLFVVLIAGSVVAARRSMLLLRFGSQAASVFKLLVWTFLTVLAPIIAFPAFAQEVNLRGSGANQFFLAILVVAVCGHVVTTAIRWSPIKLRLVKEGLVARWRLGPQTYRQTGNDGSLIKLTSPWSLAGRVLVVAALCVGLLALLSLTARARIGEMMGVAHIYRSSHMPKLEDLRSLRGSMFMTNINVPIVSYYVQYPGFGVCNPESVSNVGVIDASHCKVAFVRRHEYWAKQIPRYFVFFTDRAFFPGFADCIPEGLLAEQQRMGASCVREYEAKLRRNFAIHSENPFFIVFLLDRAKVSDM